MPPKTKCNISPWVIIKTPYGVIQMIIAADDGRGADARANAPDMPQNAAHIPIIMARSKLAPMERYIAVSEHAADMPIISGVVSATVLRLSEGDKSLMFKLWGVWISHLLML